MGFLDFLLGENGVEKVNLGQAYVDVISYEQKTREILREVVTKGEYLDEEHQERMQHALDQIDIMTDLVPQVCEYVQGYLTVMGIPETKLSNMPDIEFRKYSAGFMQLYRQYRAAYDELYNQYTYLAELGYFNTQQYYPPVKISPN